jgi:hypothetical protein
MAMKEVKLNTTGIKFTPSCFITYYEVNTNFSVQSATELLKLEEVKAVLNTHEPIIRQDNAGWSIGISVPLKEFNKTFSK